MAEQPPSELRELFRGIANDAEAYFVAAAKECLGKEESRFSSYGGRDEYWNQLTEQTRYRATELIGRLLPPCATLGQLARTSPLTGTEDVQDIKTAAKAMSAALRLRRYIYREPEAIHEEGSVIGFRPAEQSENQGASPKNAKGEFFSSLSTVAAVLKLVDAAGPSDVDGQPALDIASKYRAGTAFIMMWMDTQHPELMDVADAVRSVFGCFGVRAIRADDIEHESLITERILTEIRTSEFLFADLTGMRQNVYYEVGYAHALGKRVILFRKSGTNLHFDLAGYNCPEYENLRDLREKLTRRMTSLTNRNPSQAPEI
jgi:hypothetical protein